MAMIFKTLLFLVQLNTLRSSLVIDSRYQKNLYVSDYCPGGGACPEGSHVVCMYYDPLRTMGPRCSGARNVTVNEELAQTLLDMANMIRSRFSLGKEQVRGYGIFRFKWDPELATLAQLWANQCSFGFDMCRSTKRFSDVGQVVGIVRFKYPDWQELRNKDLPPGLNMAKIHFAITTSMNMMYMNCKSIPKAVIERNPFNRDHTNAAFTFMNGPATHMGCGISAFTKLYAPTKTNYNIILLVCNFSSYTKYGESIFNTQPPNPGSGLSARCGCPKGSFEDEDCLCNLVDEPPGPTPKPCKEENCEPTVVLLPIFTVEDAPPDKLIGRTHNMTYSRALRNRDNFTDFQTAWDPKSIETIGFIKDPDTQIHIPYQQELSNIFTASASPYDKNDHHDLPVLPLSPISLHEEQLLHSRHPTKAGPLFLNPILDSHNINLAAPVHNDGAFEITPKQQADSHKASIFRRGELFRLPPRNNIHSYSSKKTDVRPRKDFSRIQKVVNDYYKHHDHGLFNDIEHEHEHVTLKSGPHKEYITEYIPNQFESNDLSHTKYVTLTKNSFMNKSDHENSNDNIMTLLNTLEKEVKHIELDGTEKEIFDSKLRKIYGAVVGKPDNLLAETKIKHVKTDTSVTDVKDHEAHHANNNVEDDLLKYGHHLLSDDEHNYAKEKILEVPKKVNRIKTYELLDNSQPEVDTSLEEKYNDKVHKINYYHLSDKYDESHRFIPIYNDYTDQHIPPKHNNKEYRTLRHGLDSTEESKYINYDKYGSRRTKTDHNDFLKRRDYYVMNDDKKAGNYETKTRKQVTDKGIKKGQLLSAERRKFYENKLNEIERKLQIRTMKENNSHANKRPLRKMRPNKDRDMQMPRSETQIDALYMPDRARYLHGF